MRQVYAHDATVEMNPTDDPDALGAAVTVALCGDSQHEPPCPLAPHHIATDRLAEEVRLRILFATEPDLEAEVRRRIDQALASGQLLTPHRGTASWQVLTSAAGVVHDTDRGHGERLIRS